MSGEGSIWGLGARLKIGGNDLAEIKIKRMGHEANKRSAEERFRAGPNTGTPKISNWKLLQK